MNEDDDDIRQPQGKATGKWEPYVNFVYPDDRPAQAREPAQQGRQSDELLMLLADSLIEDRRPEKIALRTVALLYANDHWSMIGLKLRKVAKRYGFCHVALWREYRRMQSKLALAKAVVTNPQRKRPDSVTAAL